VGYLAHFLMVEWFRNFESAVTRKDFIGLGETGERLEDAKAMKSGRDSGTCETNPFEQKEPRISTELVFHFVGLDGPRPSDWQMCKAKPF
jgi:hypothetical protein